MPLEVEIVADVKGEKRLDGHFADVGMYKVSVGISKQSRRRFESSLGLKSLDPCSVHLVTCEGRGSTITSVAAQDMRDKPGSPPKSCGP